MPPFTPDSMWYDWLGRNSMLFELINGMESPLLDPLMAGLAVASHPGIFPYVIAAALILSLARPMSILPRNLAVFAVSYVLTSMIIVPVLKSGLDFPRPATVLGEAAIRLLGHPDPAQSFPSGHAAFAVVLAASLAPGTPILPRVGLIAFAFLSCLSRVWVGAHFPADVIGGVLIALVVVFLSRTVLRRIAK